MGKPSYEDLKGKIEVLELEALALEEEKEALGARAEASEAAEELAKERLQDAERALANRVDELTEEQASPEREAMAVINTTKNRMEIKGVVALPGKKAVVTAEQMADERIYRRINRALETGVLKEVK